MGGGGGGGGWYMYMYIHVNVRRSRSKVCAAFPEVHVLDQMVMLVCNLLHIHYKIFLVN